MADRVVRVPHHQLKHSVKSVGVLNVFMVNARMVNNMKLIITHGGIASDEILFNKNVDKALGVSLPHNSTNQIHTVFIAPDLSEVTIGLNDKPDGFYTRYNTLFIGKPNIEAEEIKNPIMEG
jgi:hypothetical protein